MIKTVMFDLDDTIYDHKHHRLCGLQALQNVHPRLSEVPLAELEWEHERLLSGNYTKVLDRQQTTEESRLERMRLLFENYGIPLTDEETRRYTSLYRKAYDENTRAVPGVLDLIKALKPSVSIGVVTNGLHDIQLQKLRVCQAETLADYIVISGDLGVRKPEKVIFEYALSQSGAKPEEAVLIGDSWELDILGASGCGISTIWINRYDKPCPVSGLTLEVRSFEETQKIVKYIYTL